MRKEHKRFFKSLYESRSFPEREQIFLEKDAEFAKRREALLEVLRNLVQEQIKIDPNFNLTLRKLDKLIKANPSSFFGIRTATSVVRYWNNEFNYLKEKLGLPITERTGNKHL